MGSEEQVLFPIWSEKEFAELCKWDNYQPTPIPLDDFMEKLLPKLEKDSVMSVSYTHLTLPTKRIV